VIFTGDIKPYKVRKVRILNGAHTCLVLVGYLCGLDYVRESVEDDLVGKFLLQTIFEEICPTLDLPKAELESFANDVLDRFRNPYLKHALLSISLNSVSKFKARVLPSLLEYVKRKGEVPKRLSFSLAALIQFYKGERNGEAIPLKDDAVVLQFFERLWQQNPKTEDDFNLLVNQVLSNIDFWGQDLTLIGGLENIVSNYLFAFYDKGVKVSLNVLCCNSL